MKRAAMLFDRLCVPEWRDPEESIPASLKIDLPHYEQSDSTWNKVRDELFEEYKRSKLRENRIGSVPGILLDDFNRFVDEFEVRLWVEQFRLSGYIITPVYDTQQRFASDYPTGSAMAYQAALENIPEIVEDRVTWEQVVEFRSDDEAKRKYRQIRLWLEGTLAAHSVDHARDLIAQRIENYEWAIRKHGLQTATGALSSVFDWKGLASIGASVGIGATLGEPLWSALATALVVTGKVSVWVAERMIDKKAIQRGPDSPVALICDAKRLGR